MIYYKYIDGVRMYANRYLKIFDVDSKLLDERKNRKDNKKIYD